MKKNVLNEINQMKYLFGYQKGKVISEQENLPEIDEVMFADPDVMEPEVKPDMDIEEKPYRPGRPDRNPSRLPYTDPDTHPQGEFDGLDFEDDDDIDFELDFDDIDLGPEVAPAPTREKERTREREKETEKPYRPGRPNRDPGKLPYTDPDTHPQGKESHYDSESEPFEGADSALENLVMKYLKNRD
jgi:hypothetical protein